MPKAPKGGGRLKGIKIEKGLSTKQREELLQTLQDRFEKNKARHKGVDWKKVLAKLEASPKKLEALGAMESTGGEPDVVVQGKKTGTYTFYDCSPESPKGRRSICYDGNGQKEREKQGINPAGNAVDLAKEMGIELLTEDEYRQLQDSGEFDLKTSSWVETPADIRKLGGAVFCDRRYNTVFTYHNGAGSFYGARGFRGKLIV